MSEGARPRGIKATPRDVFAEPLPASHRRVDLAKQLVKLGLRIVELRERQGLTQEELAELTGFSRRQMQRIEAGKTNVSVTSLALFAAALRCTIAQLFAPTDRVIRRRSGRPARR
jgi:DNA-binding XRE family transcriptional regulator